MLPLPESVPTISSATINPLPRRSPIHEVLLTTSSRPLLSRFPMLRALPCISFSLTSLNVARPAAAERGLPPKVLKFNAVTFSMISARATTPARVIPFPTPFAKVSMSGVIPCAWYPQKCSPVLPQPVCTSSLISRVP